MYQVTRTRYTDLFCCIIHTGMFRLLSVWRWPSSPLPSSLPSFLHGGGLRLTFLLAMMADTCTVLLKSETWSNTEPAASSIGDRTCLVFELGGRLEYTTLIGNVKTAWSSSERLIGPYRVAGMRACFTTDTLLS